MAIEVVMPKFGWTMESGVLAEWNKHDGDRVAVGDVLFTVESDKALNEVESFETGILRLPPGAPGPGATVAVGALLAYIVQEGEPAPFEAAPSAQPPRVGGSVPPAQPLDRAPLPRAPSLRAGEGPGVGANYPRPARHKLSPRARRAAGELGVDLDGLTGSGRGGRLVERDVHAAAARLPQATPAPSPRPASAPLATEWAAPVTLTTEADATELVHLLAVLELDATARLPSLQGSFSAQRPPDLLGTHPLRPAFGRGGGAGGGGQPGPANEPTPVSPLPLPALADLLIKIAAHALREHPRLNARLDGDDIIEPDGVHIAVTMETERGALAPVVRDAHAKPLRQIARERQALAELALAGRLPPEAAQGATFTLTDLGAHGVDAFTPRLSPLGCAALGLGRVTPKLVVTDEALGQTAVRPTLFLSLTFDHRLVDGAPAARFLQRLTQLMQQPAWWLAA